MTYRSHELGLLKCLYGNGKPNKTKVGISEAKEQMNFICWLRQFNIPHYHPANGGKRDKREAFILKLMGVSAGVPDVCIPRARKGYHGLYIELKRADGGVLSESQKRWLDILTEEGYLALEINGANEAIKVTKEYLSKEKVDERKA